MRVMLIRAACCVALSLATVVPCLAHETDQYTLPVGREFVDLGPHFTAWAYTAIERGVNKTNARIRSDLAAGRDPSSLQTSDAIASAVNREFPVAIVLIESLDSQMTSIAMKDCWPGYLPGYKPPPSFGKYVLYPLNPFRAWNCATLKVHGVYLGTDKIGHFTDMGMHYYRTYRGYLAKGESEEQAMRRAIAVGTDDPIKSESGLLGYWTAGAYSNADLVINYMGLVFYRNLTEPQKLKGELRPPMLQRDGPFWQIAPHVGKDLDFLSYFFSEHMDEALNPSHYLTGMREGMRKMARENASSMLELRRDEFGNRRSQEYYKWLAHEVRTYWGYDYGHRGSDDELVLMHEVCFPSAPLNEPKSRDVFGRTPLHRAAEAGDVQLVHKLLAARADVNAQIRSSEQFSSEWGNTPLHLAALNGRDAVVKLLIERGANVNAVNDRGATPLHLSLKSPAAMQQLLAHGAKTTARDVRGRTPLHWAAKGSDYDALALLLDGGADVNSRDYSGQTPLYVAAYHARAAASAELISRGADVGVADSFGVTPLHLACSNQALAVAELLVHAGAPLDARDDLGCTALHESARNEANNVIALLLESGAQPSVADRYGTTPLHVASRKGDQSSARLLLAGGADAHVRAGPRGTPIDEAMRFGHMALATLLRDEESRATPARSNRQ